MTESFDPVPIFKRPTKAGRTTYWIDNPVTGELTRVSQSTALRMVQIGKARWVTPRAKRTTIR